MCEEDVLLFISFWISLFILFLGLASSVICLECLGVVDNFLVVLLCALSSFEVGKICVNVSNNLK